MLPHKIVLTSVGLLTPFTPSLYIPPPHSAALLPLMVTSVNIGLLTPSTPSLYIPPLRALDMALRSRQPQPGLLHHSDRGSQYAGYAYQTVLHSRAIQPSMSRTANCYDNAVMESFFASLKAELVDHRRFVSVAQALTEIFHYIEAFYNRKRLHSALGYRCPNDYEATFTDGA